MPTTAASTDARQRWASSRLLGEEIHLESPVRVATFPSRVIADLKRIQGRPVLACLRNAWLDRHALVAQDAEPPAGGLLGRVVGGDDDPADARGEDRVGARRRLALVTAG